MTPHILLVEDDGKTRMMLTYRLQHAGYLVTQATDGEAAIALMTNNIFDVVLTDIVLGDVDGIDLLQAARLQPYRPEVIILTGHGSLETSIAALRKGAYDYLLKPCSSEQLLACIEGAVSRRKVEWKLREAASNVLSAFGEFEGEPGTTDPTQTHLPRQILKKLSQTDSIQHIGALSIGGTRHDVIFEGKAVRLTPTEYALLRYLSETPGLVRSCHDIVRYTHGLETSDTEAQAMLRSHIRNLRRKIDASYLVNDRGTGYMLVAPDATENQPDTI